jgi:tetratricopeptide (TPR) repeat protein
MMTKAQLQQYEQAIADYDEAIRLEPEAATYHSRGLAKLHLQQYEQAIADYDEAIRLEPAQIMQLPITIEVSGCYLQ